MTTWQKVSLGLWVVWFVYFAVVEGITLFNGKRSGDTLSEHVWMWFGINKSRPKNGWVRLRRFLLLAFMVWVTVHFVTGGWV